MPIACLPLLQSKRFQRVIAWGFWMLLGSMLLPAQAQTTLDSFDPAANAAVFALAVQNDGKVLVGGNFTSIAGQARSYLARLNSDGSLDTSFLPNILDAGVRALKLQTDGKILLGGYFHQIGIYTRNRIARLNADGSVDTSFDPGAGADGTTVYALALQTDGKVVLGGTFTTVGGQPRNRIARLNANGSLDSTFNPNANSSVVALALQTDGKVVLGGDFSSVAGVTRNKIARLNANGSLDTAFDPNANNSVQALALQTDGKLVLGGVFTIIGSTTRNRLARLNADANGSLDTSFNPDANSNVLALAVQADGKLVLAGIFSSVGGQVHNGIARWNASGSADATFTFNPNVDSAVFALAAYADGSKLAFGGQFTLVDVVDINGNPIQKYIARLQ